MGELAGVAEGRARAIAPRSLEQRNQHASPQKARAAIQSKLPASFRLARLRQRRRRMQDGEEKRCGGDMAGMPLGGRAMAGHKYTHTCCSWRVVDGTNWCRAGGRGFWTVRKPGMEWDQIRRRTAEDAESMGFRDAGCEGGRRMEDGDGGWREKRDEGGRWGDWGEGDGEAG